ncbi:MAG: hypothetical protein ACK4JB_02810 [Reyranella sp.]
MSLTLKLELTEEQGLGLIRMAARMRLTAEDAAVNLIDLALAESEFPPTLSLDDFLQGPPSDKDVSSS